MDSEGGNIVSFVVCSFPVPSKHNNSNQNPPLLGRNSYHRHTHPRREQVDGCLQPDEEARLYRAMVTTGLQAQIY
jgi:hypothetical protein